MSQSLSSVHFQNSLSLMPARAPMAVRERAKSVPSCPLRSATTVRTTTPTMAVSTTTVGPAGGEGFMLAAGKRRGWIRSWSWGKV